jgi:hypothetical protein
MAIKKPSLKSNESRSFLIITFIACIILCSGCASLGGIYPEDKGDICANERGELRRTEDYFLKTGVMNVAGGALIGAASGAIISAIKGGDVGTDAMIGAAAGAGAGLIKTLYDNLTQENQKIDLATNGFSSLSRCRFNAADQVRASFNAGKISKPDALNKLSDLKIRFNQDISIANRIGAKISERSTEFQNNLVKEDPSVAPYLSSVKSEQITEESTQTDTDSLNSTYKSTTSDYKAKSNTNKISKLTNKSRVVKSPRNQIAKNQIKSTESLKAADATATNIIKAKNYQDSVKNVSKQENFAIEGQIGLYKLPSYYGYLTVTSGCIKLCSVQF